MRQRNALILHVVTYAALIVVFALNLGHVLEDQKTFDIGFFVILFALTAQATNEVASALMKSNS